MLRQILPSHRLSAISFVSTVLRNGSSRGRLLSTAAAGQPPSTTSTSSSVSSSATAELDQQLLMFPEYKTALTQEASGQYHLILPTYERMHDSLVHALGAKSPLTTHMMFKIANTNRLLGNYEKARKFLNTQQSQVTNSCHHAIRISTHLSLLSLLLHERNRAVQYANEAVMLCESENDHADSVNIDLFSNSYAMLGISQLASGNLSDAETFLQLAARWAQTPLEQLIALSNNGALKWYQLAFDNPENTPFSLWEYRMLQFQENVKIAPSDDKEKNSIVGKENSMNYRLLADALHGWNETLADINNANAKSSSVADAMCGPTASKDPKAPIGMTGMAENEVKVVSENQEVVDVAKGSVNEIASNPEYAAAYANLLCNMAEAYEFTGRSVEGSDFLSSAIKVLNPHTDIRAKVALARPLRMIAHLNMKASQAVTAEGLFSSALSQLALPNAVHDYRYQYEKALVKGYYGQLLCKWEKRESMGQSYKEEAKKSLTEHHARGIPLDAMIQFPPL